MSRLIVLPAVFGLLVVFGTGCVEKESPGSHDHNQTDASRDHAHSDSAAMEDPDVVRLSDKAQETAGIEVAKVESRKCRSVLKTMAKVLAPPSQTAIVSHAFPARVAQIHVKVGDLVKKGQPMVTLDSHEVGIAKSEFYKATAGFELAKLNLDREKRLQKIGIGVKKNLLAVETDHKISEANLEAAEKMLHVLGFTEAEVEEITGTHQINATITLHSPIPGKVVTSEAILGDFVDQSTEILTIVDPTLLWVAAEVYEKDIAKVKLGQEVEIIVPAYPEKVFSGKISYIGDVVNEETRTTTVHAEVRNGDHLLKPGMFANVDVQLNGSYDMLVVPSGAMLEDGYRKIVFVKEADCFRRRQIKTGPVEGEYQQVLDGLKASEVVVVVGNHLLNSKLQTEVLSGAHHTH